MPGREEEGREIHGLYLADACVGISPLGRCPGGVEWLERSAHVVPLRNSHDNDIIASYRFRSLRCSRYQTIGYLAWNG